MCRWVAVLLLTLVVVCLLWSLACSALMGQSVSIPSVSAVLSLAAPATPSGSSSVVGRPSLSAAFINRVLAVSHSPAVGLGQAMVADSLHFHIDDVFALAFFWHESQFGRLGVAVVTHSLGNIVCTSGYPSCVGRFRSYASWQAGCLDWFHLLATEYLPRGLTTVEQIVPVYAPASENDVSAYIMAVVSAVKTWRSGRLEV
jgi:hypothetical protein